MISWGCAMAGAIARRVPGGKVYLDKVRQLLKEYGLPVGYAGAIARLDRYLQEKPITAAALVDAAEKYRSEAVAGRAAYASFNLWLVAVRRFVLRHLRAQGATPAALEEVREVMSGKARQAFKLDKEIKDNSYLTPGELELLTEHATLRTALFIELLQVTGCRVSELVGLQLEKLSQDSTSPGIWSAVVLGKGAKPRTVYLPADLVARCREVFAGRVYLLETCTFQQYKRQQVARMITTAGRAAADALSHFPDLCRIEGLRPEVLRKVHPHMVRHAYATQAVKSGLELLKVSRYLGHASIGTTAAFYVHDKPTPGEALGIWSAGKPDKT